jgi:hypothetical protein
VPKPNSSRNDLNEFKVFGPFELKRCKRSKTLDPEESERAIKHKMKLDYPSDNIDIKGGCYIIGIRKSGRVKGGCFTPWYVGKAVRQSLFDESLHGEKWKKVFPLLGAMNGTVVMFWIAKAAPGHKAALNEKDIVTMERELIKEAARCNPELINKHHNTELPFKILGLPIGNQQHPRAKTGPARKLGMMLQK